MLVVAVPGSDQKAFDGGICGTATSSPACLPFWEACSCTCSYLHISSDCQCRDTSLTVCTVPCLNGLLGSTKAPCVSPCKASVICCCCGRDAAVSPAEPQGCLGLVRVVTQGWHWG